MFLDPFPHLIVDDFLPVGLREAAALSWPAPDWPGWVHYETKAASDLKVAIPPACSEVVRRIALRAAVLPDVVMDLSLYGGGLHQIDPGKDLRRHRDASHHARLGLRRALSAVCYIHPHWLSEWGGELHLWAGDAIGKSIRPLPGRLVIFVTDDRSWHSVSTVTGPSSRLSIAIFGYGPPDGPPSRPRAEFQEPPHASLLPIG